MDQPALGQLELHPQFPEGLSLGPAVWQMPGYLQQPPQARWGDVRCPPHSLRWSPSHGSKLLWKEQDSWAHLSARWLWGWNEERSIGLTLVLLHTVTAEMFISWHMLTAVDPGNIPRASFPACVVLHCLEGSLNSFTQPPSRNKKSFPWLLWLEAQ